MVMLLEEEEDIYLAQKQQQSMTIQNIRNRSRLSENPKVNNAGHRNSFQWILQKNTKQK